MRKGFGCEAQFPVAMIIDSLQGKAVRLRPACLIPDKVDGGRVWCPLPKDPAGCIPMQPVELMPGSKIPQAASVCEAVFFGIQDRFTPCIQAGTKRIEVGVIRETQQGGVRACVHKVKCTDWL